MEMCEEHHIKNTVLHQVVSHSGKIPIVEQRAEEQFDVERENDDFFLDSQYISDYYEKEALDSDGEYNWEVEGLAEREGIEFK